jgi:hypothetical protein
MIAGRFIGMMVAVLVSVSACATASVWVHAGATGSAP